MRYNCPEESKACFLEHQRAAIVTLAAWHAVIEFAQIDLEAKANFLLQKVSGTLTDMPTLMELAANGLVYLQSGFPGFSMKEWATYGFEMGSVYTEADKRLKILSIDASLMLSGEACIFEDVGKAAPTPHHDLQVRAMLSFVGDLDPSNKQLFLKLMQHAMGDICKTFQ